MRPIRKRMVAAAAAGLMSISFAAGVYADDWIQKVTAYLRSDFSVVVNGVPANLSNPVLIYDNNSYLPLKEIASRLSATVNWDEYKKTIYINNRIYPQQPDDPDDVVFDEIKLENPSAYMVRYLGRDYPVLINMGRGMYYRLKDVQQMGIDTKGLHKAKEKYTGELYVNETELQKAWKETPLLTYGEEMPIIAGEKDDFKLIALRGYVKDMSNYKIGDKYYYHNPIFIEKLEEENHYRYLVTENGTYYDIYLQLTELKKDYYVVGSYSKKLIGDLVPTPNY
ncbi:stalk domain-containing protein [Paenibacillus lutrae]|uniref:Copper amine oxidase-like N-terminal domain-containing protein n=1 Tax=Paenibacillus lutrae TaxID=2078573 RepID=A0A7X3FH74_9BACL|nr:stalk domain-containing protein [Paenibacillus lutrae]MVO99296.1 hypothetical protein [Paenibacillus lutrae]